MNLRSVGLFATMWCASTLLAGCNGAGSPSVPSPTTPFNQVVPDAMTRDAQGKNVVQNGSFDTGKLEPWTSCGTASASISTKHPYDGHYDALTGSMSATQEVRGWSAICQRVTIPSNAMLSAWLYQVTNEPTIRHGYQEVALADNAGRPTVVLEKTNADHVGWVQKTWRLDKYAGKSETLFFGVYRKGRLKYYDMQFIDHVSLTGTQGLLPVANPTKLAFSSATMQRFTVVESGYTGTLTTTTSNAGVATVGPSSAIGPNATFMVTPVGGGRCTISVEDAHQQKATVSVTVDNGIIIIDHSSMKRSDGGGY